MTDIPDLRPASPDEIVQALSFALRYDGRKRVTHGDDMMARITADRLVLHLELAGFVLMKKAPLAAPSTSRTRRRHADQTEVLPARSTMRAEARSPLTRPRSDE